jgi:hypothetical protein
MIINTLKQISQYFSYNKNNVCSEPTETGVALFIICHLNKIMAVMVSCEIDMTLITIGHFSNCQICYVGKL